MNGTPLEIPKVNMSYNEAVAGSVPQDVYFEEPTEANPNEDEDEDKKLDESIEDSQFDLNEDSVEMIL